MPKHGVFMSCGNQECRNRDYTEITSVKSLEVAYTVAEELNRSIYQPEVCPNCKECLIYIPYSEPQFKINRK